MHPHVDNRARWLPRITLWQTVAGPRYGRRTETEGFGSEHNGPTHSERTRMIISDTHKFAFVHIPKCGGTSVRSTLARFDDRASQYFDKGRAPHGALGELDYPHIPLAILREYFPADFECVASYTAFAIVRNPFDRFPSSVFQRIRTTNSGRISSDDIRQEIDQVIESLLGYAPSEPILAPDLIHFSRQRDYVSLGERRVVGNVYSLDEIPSLISAVSELTNESIPPVKRENERLRYSNASLEAADRWLQVRIVNNIPRRIWKPVFTVAKSVLMQTGVLKRPDDWHSTVFRSPDVQQFIREFYSDDISLFASCSDANRGIL